MGEFYGKKIVNGDINVRTGMAWKFVDVPNLWKKRTEKWLKSNAPEVLEEN